MTSSPPPWPLRELPADKRQARKLALSTLRAAPPHGTGAALRALEDHVLPAQGLVATYVPLPSEVPLQPMLASLGHGRLAWVCVEDGPDLVLRAWDGTGALASGALGVQQPPRDARRVSDEAVTAVLVPGIAFGPAGQRLGRGGGYYDRLLARVPRALRVSITSEHHLWSAVPTDPWDLPVHVLVTAERTVRVPHAGAHAAP